MLKPLQSARNFHQSKFRISHGDRLSPSDKKRIARDIASTDPECTWTEDALAEKLGVIWQTVNTWIADIRARQKASRNTVIIRLSRLGWPQEKISEVVGLSRNRASEIVGNANFGEIDTLLSQGHDMEYIAKYYNMELPLVWALRLEGKTDQEKFKELGWGCSISQNPAILSSALCLPITNLRLLISAFCPLSSERLSGNQVQKMQDKRILGTVGRTLLIAKRS